MFIEKRLNLTNKGILSFIVPKPLINNENYEGTRKLLIQRGLKDIIIGSGIFENADVESCIFISCKSHGYNVSEVNSKKQIVYKFTIPIYIMGQMPFYMINTELSNKKLSVVREIQNAKTIKIENILDITRGIECGKNDGCIIDNRNNYKLLRGNDMNRYSIYFNSLYCNYNKNDIKKFKQLDLYFGKKILIRRVSNKLIATVDNDNYLCLNTIYCAKLKKSDYKEEFICAIINSKLMRFWFTNMFVLTDKVFPYIRQSQLNFIPIPKILLSQQQPIIKLVDRILTEKHTNPLADILEQEKEIDRLVYALYGLTDDEIINTVEVE